VPSSVSKAPTLKQHRPGADGRIREAGLGRGRRGDLPRFIAHDPRERVLVGRVDVDGHLDADRGVDGNVDGHAPHRVLVAVDASRLPRGSDRCCIAGEWLVVVDEERVRSGERGEVAGGLLVATVRERGTAVEDQADHGDHGDEGESEDDDDLADVLRGGRSSVRDARSLAG
jgi:hypothetical protein